MWRWVRQDRKGLKKSTQYPSKARAVDLQLRSAGIGELEEVEYKDPLLHSVLNLNFKETPRTHRYNIQAPGVNVTVNNYKDALDIADLLALHTPELVTVTDLMPGRIL